MSRGNKTTAALLTAAILLVSAPEVQAGKEKLPKPPEITKGTDRNAASALGHGLLKKIGGRILNIQALPEQGITTVASSVGALNIGSRSVNVDTGGSLVVGSSGEYTLEASSMDLGRNNRLDRSDVDRIQITSGSHTDGDPLFSARIYSVGNSWADDPLFANSFYIQGSAIGEDGSRDHFFGSAHPEFLGNVLDRSEVANTGSVINGIINEALSGQPTRLIAPPINPIK